ncbi:MAG: rhamnan synthesis F family protein [Floccifex sp.]
MNNIYDIRRDKKLLYILEDKSPLAVNYETCLDKIAIVINLYYENYVERYLSYIYQIPKTIDVYVFSSSKAVIEKVNRQNNSNITVLKKDNRGRDISALLVGFYPYYDKYSYICFLHDKNNKTSRTREDTDNWIKNIWENLILSDNYIYSVVSMLTENENIGVAVPPEPFGEYVTAWYSSAWGNNFDNCMELARTLDLSCDLDRNKSPLAISTAFWARTDAIKKIFEQQWTYADFPAEPMPNDGTISHAIERIWGYLAQDAGYDIATIMNYEYAVWELLNVQDASKKMFQLMQEELYVHNLFEINSFKDRLGKLEKFMKKNQKNYLYGAGKYGRDLLLLLRKYNLEPDGFCVTELPGNVQEIDHLQVVELSEVVKKANVGIIISANVHMHDEMIMNMKKNNFNNYYLAY